MKRLALLRLLVPVAAGCASAQAKSPVDRPNLEVPAPPPRVIESRAAYDAPPPEPVPDLPAASPSSPRPRPVPPARESKPDPKQEAPPAEIPLVDRTQWPTADARCGDGGASFRHQDPISEWADANPGGLDPAFEMIYEFLARHRALRRG